MARLWLFTVSILAAACAPSDEAAPTGDRDLLTGWSQVGEAEWQTTDDIIEPREGSGTGFITTDETHTDFHLRLEFWVAPETNSGVFVRCSDRRDVSSSTCYEANIWDEHANQDHRTGALVQIAKPEAIVDTLNKWNVMEVTCADERITISVNGTTTVDVEDERHSQGFIALQYGGNGVVRFRSVAIETR